jgi:hypothetical protein
MSTPDNINNLSSVQFKFDIKRLPDTSYFLQTAMLPGMDMDAPQVGSPRRNRNVTGSQIEFDPLVITFIVDEDMNNYLEIYRWMMFMMRNDDERQNYSDASLHILTGQMNSKMVARFVNIFPTSLTELNFGTNDDDNITMVCTATFNYTYFDFPNVSTTMGSDDLADNNLSFQTQVLDLPLEP